MKIAKLYVFQVTYDPNGGLFVGALCEKENQNKWQSFAIDSKESKI